MSERIFFPLLLPRARSMERVESSRYSRLFVRIGDRCKIIMSTAALDATPRELLSKCNINLISIKYSRRYAFAGYNLPSNYQFPTGARIKSPPRNKRREIHSLLYPQYIISPRCLRYICILYYICNSFFITHSLPPDFVSRITPRCRAIEQTSLSIFSNIALVFRIEL
ncbi:hypothetical protein PUN28_013558 [Cardiocondyla obscurior]|uniref:Uncharacterized protein n=1 Tax=Cardiocondyla obscurior TaxID=286306 RepID=A0AAW2F4F5_9HYME